MKSRNLTIDEIVTATREVVKVVQSQAFPKELAVFSRISHGTPSLISVTRKNNLSFVGHVSPPWNLNLVMVDGVISVRGRLERASIKLSAKHPMILPKASIMLLI